MLYEFRIRAKDMASLHSMILEAAENIKGGQTGKVYSEQPAVGHTAFPALPDCAVAQPMPIAQATQSAQPELDSAGVPWNPNFHTSTKAKKADGTWKARRGTGKDEAPAAVPQAPVAPAPMPTVPVAMPPFAEMPPAAPPLSVVPAAPAPMPAPPGLPSAYTLETFKGNFVNLMADLVNKGKINQEYISRLKQHFNLKEIEDIVKNDIQTKELFDLLVSIGFVSKIG